MTWRGDELIPTTVTVTVSNDNGIQQTTTIGTINCETNHRKKYANTLYNMILEDPCKVQFVGDTSIVDNLGNAFFEKLTLERGPPGKYMLSYSSTDVEGTITVMNAENPIVYTGAVATLELAYISIGPPQSPNVEDKNKPEGYFK